MLFDFLMEFAEDNNLQTDRLEQFPLEENG
jgi:hypothetical protein